MSTIEVFAIEHIARLTGLSERQIEHWDRTGVYSPSLSRTAVNRPDSRIYSFRDLVALRALALIAADVLAEDLRHVGIWLRHHVDAASPCSQLSIALDAGTVICDESGLRPEAADVRRIGLETVAADMRTRSAILARRAPTDIGQIQQHPDVVQNAPVLAGTRIPTRAVWDFHEAGFRIADILREYPTLTEEDVAVAIEYERSHQHAAS